MTSRLSSFSLRTISRSSQLYNRALLTTFKKNTCIPRIVCHKPIVNVAKSTHYRFISMTSTTTPAATNESSATEVNTGFYGFNPVDKKGEPFALSQMKGKVVLVVNVASKCGLTPQYEGLENIYAKYKDQGFEVLGFPCGQFAGQEFNTSDEIQNFCTLTYGVKFPVLGKLDVNGDSADPLYKYLKAEKPGIMGLKRIKWNFEKFLISRDGKVVSRFAPTTKPEAITGDIEKLLAEKASL